MGFTFLDHTLSVKIYLIFNTKEATYISVEMKATKGSYLLFQGEDKKPWNKAWHKIDGEMYLREISIQTSVTIWEAHLWPHSINPIL